MAPKKDAVKKKVEDATFGVKNKSKSKAVRQYAENVAKQAQGNYKQQRLAVPSAKDKKKSEEEKAKELASLFALAIKQPKVPEGVDPKSVLCEFYRHSQCAKGFKCKFSHDLNIERKVQKIDLFTDRRDAKGAGEGEGGEEGMEEWDQETLERVVKEKHAGEKQPNQTSIICKFFLEAVEKKQYGWFWKCPNGAECKYRHALPPGYVLKSQMAELLEEEAANKRDVVEEIEEARAKVEAKTPLTQQVFAAWHRSKKEAHRKAQEEAEAERKRKGILNGREIFLQEDFTVEDDDNAGADDDYRREDDEEERFREMIAEAQRQAELARQRAAAEPRQVAAPDDSEEEEEEEDEEDGEEEGPGRAGGSREDGPSAGADGAGPSTTLHLDADDAALFQDDDSDDEEGPDEDEDEEDEPGASEEVRNKLAAAGMDG